MKLGSHVSMSGKEMLLGSVEEALRYGANAFMIYTGAPQTTRRKEIKDLNIEEGLKALLANGLAIEDIVVHAPYIMNLANPDPEKRAFAVRFLTEELYRSAAIGATQIVLHPGAHVGEGPEAGIAFIIDGLKQVLANTQDLTIKIALETMAGKGTEIGRSFDELAAIIAGLDHHPRISVCFDTCHTHDAGYDIKDNFETVLAEFDAKVGAERISVLHLNDSLNPLGASKDRHANIGFGHIGFAALHSILTHPTFQNTPVILETPYVTLSDDAKDKVLPPYKEEIAMLKSGVFDPNLIEHIRAAK